MHTYHDEVKFESTVNLEMKKTKKCFKDILKSSKNSSSYQF